MPTQFIVHQGTRIVDMDLSGIEEKEKALAEIGAARQFVAAQPKVRNLRILLNVAGSRWDSDILDAMRALAAHDAPWVIASAIVGINPIMRITLRGVLLLTGRKIAVFKDTAAAKQWLVQQKVPPSVVPEEA